MNLSLPAASANAPEVDYLLLALLAISGAVLALVFGLMLLYVVKYRAGSGIDRGEVAQKTWRIETGWTAATLAAFFGLFIWGSNLYVRLFQPPPNVLKIYVIAKQWMWKAEHVGGQREIDQVHLPAGRPIQLVMTSEDVIHDFAVPAFRIKQTCSRVATRPCGSRLVGPAPTTCSARSSAAPVTQRWSARSS
jgi:cytochrome c oxidase subunit II